MGGDQPGADPTKSIQGPYGTGMSSPIFGLCPVSRDWLKESSGNPQTGHDWVRAPPQAPKHLDDTDNVMTHLAYKKINAFSGIGHGFYFWNFRTDLEEPHWSYMLALERGWIPKGNLNDGKIANACLNEDEGYFKCVMKKGVSHKAVRAAVEYIIKQKNETGTLTDEDEAVLHLKGQDLTKRGDDLITSYFDDFKASGATCDFGGIAMLVEENRTVTDDDFLGWDDDEYQVIVYRGPDWMVIFLLILLAAICGSIMGFIVAMHVNKKFNKAVRKSRMFNKISTSKNSLVRRSFALGEADQFGELDRLVKEQDAKNSVQFR
jgi:hypothetical protein